MRVGQKGYACINKATEKQNILLTFVRAGKE